ncbi:CpsD/CapB family tyrosine-protein kinase [uncultured Roseobacter sp.]|uniref:CpsD/CapB family tyrosine-protein kinase n=1 Tax=uncultured Roseobacter sp. TaxID=114847 RepID=UPI0026221437|nr:CpsD/CapB family tyrosine-protein kinase [uncultured Roseobacter sp.]
MEKLQAALEKARYSRQDSQKATRVEDFAKQANGSDLWSAIPNFEVPDHVLQHHRVVTRQAGPNAAPFDILRTKLLLQMRQNNWRRLAVTSPTPKSGKTTIACNLALGLGRQRDMRSILMDLDLRSPSISDFFETVPPHNIGDVLTRQIGFEEQALRFGDNVLCAMSSQIESDPSRILLAEDTVEVLDQIEATYKPDIVIFDLPSVLVNDDTRAFLKNVDCALIVARANTTRYGQFDICEREVNEHTNVLGTVLNAHPYNDKT